MEYHWYFSSGEKDKPPVANAGGDVVVQPDEEVLLNGIESWDDRKIIDYKWSLISGNEYVIIEVLYWILAYELICYDVVYMLLMFPVMMLKWIKMLLRNCFFVILKKQMMSLFTRPQPVWLTLCRT